MQPILSILSILSVLSIPINTNQHQSNANTNQYQSIPINTNQYQSIPINTNQHQSTPINTIQYTSILFYEVIWPLSAKWLCPCGKWMRLRTVVVLLANLQCRSHYTKDTLVSQWKLYWSEQFSFLIYFSCLTYITNTPFSLQCSTFQVNHSRHRPMAPGSFWIFNWGTILPRWQSVWQSVWPPN